MMIMKKNVIIWCAVSLAIIVTLLICFAGTVKSLFGRLSGMLDDSLSKEEIFELVSDNWSVISDDIRESDFADTLNLEGVKEVYSDKGVVDVYCGGSGSVDYGFYYSPDGSPKNTWCGTPFGNLETLGREGNGFSVYSDHNRYYTEKIRDNFYYYEAHF